MNVNKFIKYLFFIVVLVVVFATSSCTDNKKKIREDINLGIKATYAGEWKIAIDKFDNVISMDSTNAEAYMYKARALIGMRKYDKAIVLLTKAINLNPKYGEAYRSRAQVYFYLGNKDASCQDYLKAEEYGVENLHNYTKHCR